MTQFLISLDEIERIKRANRVYSTRELADRTGISRSTWTRVMKTRQPTDAVLQALARMGANPAQILVSEEMPATVAA